MDSYGTKTVAAMLLAALLMPVAGVAAQAENIQSMESQRSVLEGKAESLAGKLYLPERETREFPMGEQLQLETGKSISVSEYDTGTRFKYSPAGGFSTLTLSSKSGYRLLCLYVNVRNDAKDNLYTERLLDTVLHLGESYSNKAQDSFFYLNPRGMFAGGLKSIGPKSSVRGCLLFAIPDDMETNGERMYVQFYYGDTIYECELRPAALSLEPQEEAGTF